MHFDLLIRGGTLVSSFGTEEADIGVSGRMITRIGNLAQAKATKVLNAKGLYVLPGVIDTQVHFREPGMEHKEDLESGTRAAILGGVTTIFEMPNTQPTTSTEAALADKLERARGRAWCDFSFFVGATQENVRQLIELEKLPGTPGVKIFMGSSTGSLLVSDDDVLRRVLISGIRRCSIHAEDEPRLRVRRALVEGENVPHRMHPVWRDPEAARLATERILTLSEETGRPVHILHISTLDELPLLQSAKRRGLGTTCEVTPQHLWFFGPDCYDRLGSKVQMNPPIREIEHRAALREALQNGLFDVIGSDHAPHTIEEKSKPYPDSPSGMPGVQTLLPVMVTLARRDGLLSLNKLVRLTSENPAKLFGLKDKGFLMEDYVADFVLIDPNAEFVPDSNWLQSKSGWSPYEGETLLGKPVHTVLGGQVVVEEGTLVGKPQGQPAEFKWKEPSPTD